MFCMCRFCLPCSSGKGRKTVYSVCKAYLATFQGLRCVVSVVVRQVWNVLCHPCFDVWVQSTTTNQTRLQMPPTLPIQLGWLNESASRLDYKANMGDSYKVCLEKAAIRRTFMDIH